MQVQVPWIAAVSCYSAMKVGTDASPLPEVAKIPITGPA